MKLKIGFFLVLLTLSRLMATEGMFLPPFTKIKDENKRARETREEIERNFQLLIKLSDRNTLLETELSSVLNEIAKGTDFNMEALSVKTGAIQNSISNSAAMQDGYDGINKEIEASWKTKK